MTLAGLVSFLPALTNFGDSYVRNFLMWTFPFLIAALISYKFSSVRPNAIATQMPVFHSGTIGELLILRSKCSAARTIWTIYFNAFNKALGWFRYTTLFTYTYIFSFSINFYLFTFFNAPTSRESVGIFIISVMSGLSLIFLDKIKTKRNLNFGPNIKLKPDNAEFTK